jgi:hypothetical protein
MKVSDLERSEAKSLAWKGRVDRSVVNYLIFLAKRTNQEIQYQQLVLSIWLPTSASHYSGLATSRLTARNGKVGLYMCTAQHITAYSCHSL